MRLNVEIPETLRDRLNRVVPWGIRAALVGNTLEMLVTSIEKSGPMMLGAIIAGKIRIVYDDQD